MQKCYKIPDASVLTMRYEPDDEDATQIVVFALVVPGAAKVPAPRQQISTAALAVRPTSITSTVSGRTLFQLRVNNTASATDWCTTATLVGSQLIQPARF